MLHWLPDLAEGASHVNSASEIYCPGHVSDSSMLNRDVCGQDWLLFSITYYHNSLTLTVIMPQNFLLNNNGGIFFLLLCSARSVSRSYS